MSCQTKHIETLLTCRSAPGRIRTMAPDIAFDAGRLADDAIWTVPPAVATCRACKPSGSVRRYRARFAAIGPRGTHWGMCRSLSCMAAWRVAVRARSPNSTPRVSQRCTTAAGGSASSAAVAAAARPVLRAPAGRPPPPSAHAHHPAAAGAPADEATQTVLRMPNADRHGHCQYGSGCLVDVQLVWHLGQQICTSVMKLLVPGRMRAFTASSVMPKPYSYMKHLTLVGVCVIWLAGPAWQDDTPHVLMEVHSPFAGRRCCGHYLGHNLWRGRGQPVR